MSFAVGGRIGRYDLLEHLGEGGQGSVWRVRDVVPPHPERALKLVSLRSLSPTALERLRREAGLLKRLDHPGLVRCHGVFESYEEDVIGLELDFADGPHLGRLLRDPRFDVRHRQAVLQRVAEALAYLHENGLVHRDVKLENVVVTQAFWNHPEAPGAVRLVDLGISAQVGNPHKLTDAGRIIGTLPYMTPELIDPNHWPAVSKAGPTLDVFAFGVLGWVLLRGEHPTGLRMAASSVDFAVQYRAFDLHGPPWAHEPLRDRWDEVLRACVAPRVTSRPADASVVLRALDGGAGLLATEATPTAPATIAHGAVVTEPGAPPPEELLRSSLPPRVSAPPSGRSAGEVARTSSPLVHDVPAASTAARPPSSVPTVVVLALAGVAGALIAAVGATRLLLPEAAGTGAPPRADDAAAPPPPPPLTTMTVRKPPPATEPASTPCVCKSTAMCGSQWLRGTPGACGEPIPQGEYLLRLSFLAVRSASGRDTSAISLFDAEEDVEVCVRVAGAPAREEVCVRKADAVDSCWMGSRLRVPLTSVVGDGPGLDIVIRQRDIELARRHVRPYEAGARQQALCTGFVPGKDGWQRDPRWRWTPTKVGFFLDPI